MFQAVCLIGGQEERARLINEEILGGKWDVLITSYEMILLERTFLKKYNWRQLVIGMFFFFEFFIFHFSKCVHIFLPNPFRIGLSG